MRLFLLLLCLLVPQLAFAADSPTLTYEQPIERATECSTDEADDLYSPSYTSFLYDGKEFNQASECKNFGSLTRFSCEERNGENIAVYQTISCTCENGACIDTTALRLDDYDRCWQQGRTVGSYYEHSYLQFKKFLNNIVSFKKTTKLYQRSDRRVVKSDEVATMARIKPLPDTVAIYPALPAGQDVHLVEYTNTPGVCGLFLIDSSASSLQLKELASSFRCNALRGFIRIDPARYPSYRETFCR